MSGRHTDTLASQLLGRHATVGSVQFGWTWRCVGGQQHMHEVGSSASCMWAQISLLAFGSFARKVPHCGLVWHSIRTSGSTSAEGGTSPRACMCSGCANQEAC